MTKLISKNFILSVRRVPLGMQSTDILDSHITASSVWDSYHAAHHARLHLKANGINIFGGWASGVNDNNQWLQVDLQKSTTVRGIATQGRNGQSPGQWITEYKLQYGEDGHTFSFYRRFGDNLDTVQFEIELLNVWKFP